MPAAKSPAPRAAKTVTKTAAKTAAKTATTSTAKPAATALAKAPAKPAAKATPRPSAKAAPAPTGDAASSLIDARIEELGDWRGKVLAKVRALMHEALPDVVEEWKWAVPVWAHNGHLCTGEVYKQAVKLTFPKGAKVEDPAGLFNASLEGNARRAIDIREGEAINEQALKALFRAAAALNPPKKTKAVKA
ncbi:MAG: DUF1801 domain-containing protein [Mitsuaria chitosanitabida]|nr:DUF1801 domain-containing protein [Roseateles chitosanitabidus]